MSNARSYQFKVADTEDEFPQIHRLLHQTFVREIPRYDDPGSEYLVDKFHDRNTYFVAKRSDAVCGVIAVHAGPTFSVAKSLRDPGRLGELKGPLLEARVLAVAPTERHGIVFAGLANLVIRYAIAEDFGNIVITGLADREPMYRQMGFRAIGSTTLVGAAMFIPMAMDVSQIPTDIKRDLHRWESRMKRQSL